MTHDIAFNRATIAGREMEYVQQAVASGHTSASGPFARRAGELLREATAGEEVLLTTSCTAALELSAMLLDIGPGDTVIVPSFTFCSSALAFARQGARLLFCDIEPDTLGIDPRHLAELLDETVRAVVVVHYAGIPCDLEGVAQALAGRPDVAVVEDAAHALYGTWRGRPLGSLGRFASLSFHETKNISCGEGGALVLNDAADIDRARILYDKGTDRQAFFLGQVDKYSWRDTGSSFGLSDMLAAFLVGQLEAAEAIQARRRAVFEGYLEALREHAPRLGLQLPVVPPDCQPAYHLFHVLLPDAAMRPAVISDMREHGVAATFHYVTLHDSEGGRRFAARPTECPVSSDVSQRLLRLPFHNDLGPDDVARAAATLVRAVEAASAGRR